MWLIKCEGWETIINQDNSADPEEVVELAASEAFDDFWWENATDPMSFELFKNNELVGYYEVEIEVSPMFFIKKVD